MTDLGTWAADHYYIPGPTLNMDTSLPDSLEGDNDTEAQQNS